ncbi:MAG: PHP domain-containing protein [Chloroflexi bacterium]|nr:PHP domain-containing protein [Chloroflexota bacterium]
MKGGLRMTGGEGLASTSKISQQVKRARQMDLHVHTTYSDGNSELRAVVDKAIALGIKDLGITDHYGDLEWYSITSITQLDEYIAELTGLKQLYQPKINIWIGLEMSILNGLPFLQLNKLDYALFEDVEMGPRLSHLVSQVKPQLKIPVGIAHAQVIFLEKSADILEKEKIFIELNTHYPDRYRSNWARSIWHKLASRDIRLSVGSDAHDTKRIGDTGDAIRFMEENGLSQKLWLPSKQQQK